MCALSKKLFVVTSGKWLLDVPGTQPPLTCTQKKKNIYESDYPASQQMKFVCAVNVYASDTVAMQLLIDKYLFLNTKQLI